MAVVKAKKPTQKAPNNKTAHQFQDSDCYKKARRRGQLTFTLVEQDFTSPSVICEWIKQNIETCPAHKLVQALDEAIMMRNAPKRDQAD